VKVQIELRPEDSANPKVRTVLQANSWVKLTDTVWETAIGFQLEARDQSIAARQVLEPLLDLGIKPRRVVTKTIPMSTRISAVAREVSREFPDLANELYTVAEDMTRK
jgi:hypothetical protein